MKVAVLSDIHGNGIALKYALDDLKRNGIKKIIILGDVVMKGPMPVESLHLLRNKEFEIMAWIKGNTELWLEEIKDGWIPSNESEKEIYSYYSYAVNYLSAEEKQFLQKLPLEASININETSILCVHGTPQSIVEAVDATVPEEEIKKAIKGVNEAMILSGHSHTVYIGEMEDRIIFNVGSVGNPLDGDNRISYGILDFKQGGVQLENRRLTYPQKEIIKIAADRDFPMADKYKNIIENGLM